MIMPQKAKRIKRGERVGTSVPGGRRKSNSVRAPIFGYTRKTKLHKNTSNDQLLTNN
nr:MAG TPA: hypothetical protein [Caudoviricetes sp.]